MNKSSLAALWIVLTVVSSAAAYVYIQAKTPAPAVNIRWSPSIDDTQRAALEARFRLVDGEKREGETWSYRLADASSDNLAALVRHSDVVDTHKIDRQSF